MGRPHEEGPAARHEGHLSQIEASHGIPKGWTAATAAEMAWSLVHPASWRLLVVECGWKPGEFRATPLRAIGQLLFRTPASARRKR